MCCWQHNISANDKYISQILPFIPISQSSGVIRKCYYCDDSILEQQDLTSATMHRKCWDERERRYNAGKCIVCGHENRSEKTARCSDCSLNNTTFSGYEGPTT